MSRLTRDFFGGIPQSAADSRATGDDWVYRCEVTGCKSARRWREQPNHPQICPDHPERTMACVHNPLGDW